MPEAENLNHVEGRIEAFSVRMRAEWKRSFPDDPYVPSRFDSARMHPDHNVRKAAISVGRAWPKICGPCGGFSAVPFLCAQCKIAIEPMSEAEGRRVEQDIIDQAATKDVRVAQELSFPPGYVAKGAAMFDGRIVIAGEAPTDPYLMVRPAGDQPDRIIQLPN